MNDILIQSGETLLRPQVQPEPEHTAAFDVLHVIRILFYLLVVIKLIELSFLRRKKHSLKERVYRKFVFAHQEILKQFTDEDQRNMEHTLANTIKNASTAAPVPPKNHKKSRKRVSFITEKNSYYEPRQSKEEDEEDLFMEIDESDNLIKLEENESFQEKKVEDEFQERGEIEEINEKLEDVLMEESKITQETQVSSEENGSELQQISEMSCENKTD
jgi:hypothetical protein